MVEQNLPTAPESFIANIGAEELTTRRNAFFEKVLLSLKFNQENRQGIVEIREGIISYISPDGPIIQTQDKVAILEVRGQPVASVLEKINDDGLVHFSANYLTIESKQGLKYMPGKE